MNGVEWTCPDCGRTFSDASPNRPVGHRCRPRLDEKVASYVAAAKRDRANGRKRRTPEQVAEIREICRACEKYDAERDICRACKGCPIGLKKIGLANIAAAAVSGLPLTKPEAASEDCPRGKWPKLE